jgi:zinc transport system ATP-binding protein
MAGSPAISFAEVSFSYAAAPVLENASFEIPAGSVTAVAGPNGGGKTTLLRLALGLEKPERGRIRILGESPEKARPRVGYMPQMLRVDPLLPMTVLGVVLMGLIRPGRLWTGRTDKQAALAALESVGMAHAARRQFASLSGGERQRVLIARAVVSGPELLLFDEPTAMIDSASQGSFAAILERLRGSATIVLVTHDVGFVSDKVDRVLLVNRSVRSVAATEIPGGPVEEVYGGKLHAIIHSHGEDRQ